jgi:hypothetical protein
MHSRRFFYRLTLSIQADKKYQKLVSEDMLAEINLKNLVAMVSMPLQVPTFPVN